MAVETVGANGVAINAEATSNGQHVSLRAGVDPLHVVNEKFSSSSSGITSFGINDGRSTPMRTDRIGSVATSMRIPLFDEQYEGTTINPIRWTTSAATMAATQSSIAGLIINSGNITSINTGFLLRTAKTFMKSQRGILHGKARVRFNHYANSVMEIGFGDVATNNGVNTTGAFLQCASSGVIQCVVTFNSINTTTVLDLRPFIINNNYYTIDIVLDDDSATFFIQNTSTGELVVAPQVIYVGTAVVKAMSTSSVGWYQRVFNTGVAPATAPNLIVTELTIGMLDSQYNLPVNHIMAGQQKGWNANPFTGAQLIQWTNSAEPANATLSNTAAGYGTLGGKFQFVAVAGSVNDYALFALQIPAPGNFAITGVSIDTWNTVVASATTPTLLSWALGVGSTAVSLATATVTRVPLGTQTIPVGTAPGVSITPIYKMFTTPVVCDSGRFVHIILRIPVGTATATQVIAGTVGIEGYWF
jgi:hypothetical protein